MDVIVAVKTTNLLVDEIRDLLNSSMYIGNQDIDSEPGQRSVRPNISTAWELLENECLWVVIGHYQKR